jgi:MFS family permease
LREIEPFAVLPRGLAPLGYRNFALYLIGFSTSNTGRWIELTGSVWLLYELTHSPLLLGLLGIARAVPAIGLSPLAGVVADRVDQRRLLFVLQAMGIGPSLALGLVVLFGAVEPWHVYVQVLIQSATNAFDASVRQALFPRLVPRARLIEAVTLQHAAGRFSSLIGPAVGGVAIASWGEAAPFLMNAATFPVLMLAVIWMRGFRPPTPASIASFRGELIEGLRYIVAAPMLSGLLKLEIVFGVFQMNAVMITIVGRDVLGVGPEGLGGLLAAPALGALFGVTGLILLGQARRQGRFVVLCQFAYAATLVAFALSHNYGLAFATLALLGLLDSVVTVTRQSVMQLAAPSRMRGRVMANMGMVVRGTGPLAETQSGLVAGVLGPSPAVLVAAFALVITAGLTARTNPTLWSVSRDDAACAPDDPTLAVTPPELPLT